MKLTKLQIVSRLQAFGLAFTEFTMVHEGRYAAADASWNYKDLLHLNYVHQQARAVYTPIENDVYSCLILQKVLGFTIPVAATSYDSGRGGQVYFGTVLCFAVIVETAFEEVAPLRTRVTTTYSLGAPRALRWCLPALRWILGRNYRNLMEGDIPMRERRGLLRSWGYSFATDGHYSSEEGLDVSKANLLNPPAGGKTEPALRVELARELPADGELLLGRDDHLGLRLARRSNRLTIYPRLCPHEGASLDGQPCLNERVQCPWHGRIAGPVACFDLARPARQTARSAYHAFSLEDGVLTVSAAPA